MDPKLCLLVVLLLATLVHHQAEAEFYFQHVLPKAKEIEELDLKCVPGRTVLHIIEKPPEPDVSDSGENDDEIARDMMRSHMNSGIKEEYCKVCVCSVDGKDEYCSQRPAMNVNECLHMTKIVENFKTSGPFDHTRNLAYRIRRDYIWHNDEIPYEAKAKCKRAHSYYTNSETANDTDIDIASDVESLLDYGDKDICYYCVCSVDAKTASCLSRQPWFCEYFRLVRQEGASRDRYTKLFQQDRPTYFRQLSWRMRRTMDNGVYDFMQTVGGDELNINADKCIPFVSEYSDCTEENRCSGCNKCVCVGHNTWSCQPATDACLGDDPELDESSLDQALFSIQNQMRFQEKERSSSSPKRYVPEPAEDKDLLLEFGAEERVDVDERIRELLRSKRSVDDQTNHTSDGVKFYHTVDEINADTLKNDSISGTLQAHKVDALPTSHIASRRNGLLLNDNLPNPLHIQYNQPKVYDHHLTDNKIDATVHKDDKYDAISHEKINKIIGNQTQKQKDKDLSKLVVNELKSGTEVIGDKNGPIMSNITFTPENDTLTAMAYIAGNLLNKLWNMEKNSGEDSRETDDMKHEKIGDLLDLFKEPLNLRQENFLKNALEQLSEAVDKDKTLKNISLCDTITEETITDLKQNDSNEEDEGVKEHKKCNKHKHTKTNATNEHEDMVNTETISKINNVLTLIKKFENIQKSLNNLKKTTNEKNATFIKKPLRNSDLVEKHLTQDESESLTVFGNLLDKITKLLMPPKKSKKISKSIRNQNVFKNSQDITKTLKDMFNIDVDNETLTVKDKIIFDYLNTVKRNPKCLLDNLKEDKAMSLSRVEGDILLNLSEFFKVRSFVDLVNLIEPKTNLNARSFDKTTSKPPKTFTETTTTTMQTITLQSVDKLSKTKEKLKKHLKSIIDDLIEIQNAKGQTPNNISIVDALPCIFKMLNNDDTQRKLLNGKERSVSPVEKVAVIFENLKKDLKSTQNRRSSVVDGVRPKSAVVWERIVKNFDIKNKHNRRFMKGNEPKTYKGIKREIELIDSSSKTYKNLIVLNGVYPAERLALLKTLLEEVKRSMNVLYDINNSLDNLKDISTDKKMDLKDFVDNVETNINLNKKVARNINKVKLNKNIQSRGGKVGRPTKASYIQKHSMRMLDVSGANDRNNIKLSRDAIINQLIRNRMQLYVKVKEAKETDLSTDVNYDIAKRILLHLDSGNYNLARELYKVLISQKQKTTDAPVSQFQVAPIKKKSSILMKEPVVQFEEPKRVQWLSQDAWIKQLMNLKNMRV